MRRAPGLVPALSLRPLAPALPSTDCRRSVGRGRVGLFLCPVVLSEPREGRFAVLGKASNAKPWGLGRLEQLLTACHSLRLGCVCEGSQVARAPWC